jgi:hypothetical protein
VRAGARQQTRYSNTVTRDSSLHEMLNARYGGARFMLERFGGVFRLRMPIESQRPSRQRDWATEDEASDEGRKERGGC